jgi:hypothetical protein
MLYQLSYLGAAPDQVRERRFIVSQIRAVHPPWRNFVGSDFAVKTMPNRAAMTAYSASSSSVGLPGMA